MDTKNIMLRTYLCYSHIYLHFPEMENHFKNNNIYHNVEMFAKKVHKCCSGRTLKEQRNKFYI